MLPVKFEKKWYDNTKEIVGEYLDHVPTPTCLKPCFYSRNYSWRWPYPYGDNGSLPRSTFREIGWENFPRNDSWTSCCMGCADIDPKYQNPELTTSEPYVMGSHATCSGAWCSGPEDLSHQNTSGDIIV